MKHSVFGIYTLALLLMLVACKQKDLFPDSSGRIYALKADTVKLMPGRNRMQISFAVPDQKITKVKIYWNDKKDVKELPVNALAGAAKITAIIEGLEEKTYDFEIVTYDAAGNTSIPVKATGTVLGANFESSLQNRDIKEIRYDDNAATLYWAQGNNEVQTQVTYTINNNSKAKFIVPTGSNITVLPDFKPEDIFTTIEHKTAYLPENTIDTFYAKAKVDTVITGTIRALANAKGVKFGSLITYGLIANNNPPNDTYQKICLETFNTGQILWWAPSNWQQAAGTSNFSVSNFVINWSKTNYNHVFATLITGRDVYEPLWFLNGSFTPAQMDDLLKNLVKDYMESNDNKSKADVWGVTNELFTSEGLYNTMKWNDMGWEDDASGLTGPDKINARHPVFIGKALQYCRQYTNALLEIRDHNVEFNTSASPYYHKHKAFYQLIKHLKAKGYPIDVAGIQAHYYIGREMPGGMEQYKQSLQKFKAAGVKVYFTELDLATTITGGVRPPWTNELAEQQKQDYYNIVKAAYEAGVDYISLWGVKDNNDINWRWDQHPLLYDENYNKKPAYFGVQKALFDLKK